MLPAQDALLENLIIALNFAIEENAKTTASYLDKAIRLRRKEIAARTGHIPHFNPDEGSM